MPESFCRRCNAELPEDRDGPRCLDCLTKQRERRRRFWGWAGAGAAFLAATALVAITSRETDSEAEEGEELSAEAHRRIAIYLGEGKADDTADDVREGWMTAAEAEEWSKSVEHQWESTKHRPDIEPEDWQTFEEGWRPESW